MKCIIFPFVDPFSTSEGPASEAAASHFVSIPKTVAPAVAIYEDLCVARKRRKDDDDGPRGGKQEPRTKDQGLKNCGGGDGPAPSICFLGCTCFDLFGIITDAYRSYYSLLKLLTLDNKNWCLNSTRKVHSYYVLPPPFMHRTLCCVLCMGLGLGKLQFVQIFMYIENYSFV